MKPVRYPRRGFVRFWMDARCFDSFSVKPAYRLRVMDIDEADLQQLFETRRKLLTVFFSDLTYVF